MNTRGELVRAFAEKAKMHGFDVQVSADGAFHAEIAIVGDPAASDTQALLRVVRGGYRPFQVVALGTPSPEGAQVPLLQDRDLVDGRAAACVCRDFACQAPVTTPQALEELLSVYSERPARVLPRHLRRHA